MEHGSGTREWLDWLTRVRLLTIALILTVGVVWPTYRPLAGGGSYFLPLVIFWIALAALFIVLMRWLPKAGWHGSAQVVSDVLMVSALVYATGLHESYFVSLYFLVIIVANVLFSRQVALGIAAVCMTLLGGLALLAFEGKIPKYYAANPSRELLSLWFLSNVLGFLAVTYL